MLHGISRFYHSRCVSDVKLLAVIILLNPMCWWIYPNLWNNFVRPVLFK